MDKSCRFKIYVGMRSTLGSLKNESFRAAMQTTAETLSSYNKIHYRDRPVLRTKQRLFLMPYTIYFTKNSCLLKAFNKQIEKLLTSGLISTWVSQFVVEDSEQVHSTKASADTRPLTVHQLGGIFIITIILYCVSLIVFVFEVLSTKSRFIRKIVEFLTFGN